MKVICSIVFLGFFLSGWGQDEFGSKGFYEDFQIIHKDALNGFELNKGNKRTSSQIGIQEFSPKLLLPLADSGKIVFPVTGNPYVIYFFTPAKSKEEIQARAASLKNAIGTIYGKPLFARSQSVQLKKNVSSDTYFYENAEAINTSEYVLLTSIYSENKLHYLSLKIFGKNN